MPPLRQRFLGLGHALIGRLEPPADGSADVARHAEPRGQRDSGEVLRAAVTRLGRGEELGRGLRGPLGEREEQPQVIVGIGLLRIGGEDLPVLVDRPAHLALGVAHDAEGEVRVGPIRLAAHHGVQLGPRGRPLLAGQEHAGQRQARGDGIRLPLQRRAELFDGPVEIP